MADASSAVEETRSSVQPPLTFNDSQHSSCRSRRSVAVAVLRDMRFPISAHVYNLLTVTRKSSLPAPSFMSEDNFWFFSKPGDVRVESRQLAKRLREKHGKDASWS